MHYVVEKKGSNYMRLLLQVLTAILLVVLIMLAFAVRTWLLKESDTRTSTPPAAITNTEHSSVKSSPAETSSEIPVAIAIESEEKKQEEKKQEDKKDSSEETLNAVVLASISAVDVSEKEDEYISELQFQLENKQISEISFDNEELNKIVKDAADTKIEENSDNSIIDSYNKIYLPKQQSSQSNLQNTMTQLVDSSLKDIKNKSKQKNVSDKDKQLVKRLDNEADVRQNAMRTIVVKRGDTLSRISQKAYGSGSQFRKIFRANPSLLNDPHRIRPGQILRVPL